MLTVGDKFPAFDLNAVVTTDPKKDADRLMRAFLARAYRGPVAESDVQRFLALVENRRAAGLRFAEAMVAGYTAALASPRFVFLDEQPGTLSDHALATRLALFLWNSVPDAALRARADRGGGEARNPGLVIGRHRAENSVDIHPLEPAEVIRIVEVARRGVEQHEKIGRAHV